MPRPAFPTRTIRQKKRKPTMLTTDLSLRFDPIYEKISRRFLENPQAFAEAFARAWFKLTHRDLGPRSRYLGPEVPKEELLWQDPVPAVDHPLIDDADVVALKAAVLARGLTVSELVGTAWASASTFRGGDKRGGANGARIRLEPQKDWEVNRPAQLAKALKTLEGIQKEFNAAQFRREKGFARRSDRPRRLCRGRKSREGRRDRCESTVHAGTHGRVAGADGSPFVCAARTARRRFPQLSCRPAIYDARGSAGGSGAIADPDGAEMTVLVGGLRVLGANAGDSLHGVFTDQPEKLTNDFFVNLLDMRTAWKATSPAQDVFEGRDRATGELKWTGTRADLVFGSHSQLRALAEVYASADAQKKFVHDFVAAWNKVMNADRFDLV